MEITKISPYINFRVSKNNNIINTTNIISSQNTVNTLQGTYPAGYYVSFKGTQKSEEIQQFEKCIDEFYKNNIGEILSDKVTDSLLSSLPKTESKFVNDQLHVRLKDVFKNHEAINLDPKFIDDSMINSLEELTRRRGFGSKVKEVSVNIEDVPVIIARLRKEGVLSYGSIDKESFRREHLGKLFDLFVDTHASLK